MSQASEKFILKSMHICKTHTLALYEYVYYPFFVGYFLKYFVATYFLYCKIQFSWFSQMRSKCLKFGSQ